MSSLSDYGGGVADKAEVALNPTTVIHRLNEISHLATLVSLTVTHDGITIVAHDTEATVGTHWTAPATIETLREPFFITADIKAFLTALKPARQTDEEHSLEYDYRDHALIIHTPDTNIEVPLQSKERHLTPSELPTFNADEALVSVSVQRPWLALALNDCANSPFSGDIAFIANPGQFTIGRCDKQRTHVDEQILPSQAFNYQIDGHPVNVTSFIPGTKSISLRDTLATSLEGSAGRTPITIDYGPNTPVRLSIDNDREYWLAQSQD